MIKYNILTKPVTFINEEFTTIQAVKLIELTEIIENRKNGNLKNRKTVIY